MDIINKNKKSKKIMCIKRTFLLLTLFALVYAIFAYQNPGNRDVPYSAEITLFRDKGNNNEVTDAAYRRQLYENAVKSANKETDPYKKYVQLARCEYLGGMAELWGIPDFSEKPKITDELKTIIASHFDKGLEYTEKAALQKKGTDMYTIRAELLASASMVKPLSYTTVHGKEILDAMDTSVKTDPLNGEAAYFQAFEYFYAPFPLGNKKKGFRILHEILENEKMILEQADIYQIYANLANQYAKDKQYKAANEWNKKALAIYPRNPTQLKTQQLIDENLK